MVGVHRQIRRQFSFVKKMAQSIALSTERAQRVQQNVIEHNYTIQQQAKLRNKVTVETSIDSLQQQLNQQIARSLRKSQDKVKYLLEKANTKYQELRKKNCNNKENKQQVESYNKLVGDCQKARWQFMIHRQSCGFTIRNYQIVHSLYPIPPKIIPNEL